MITRRGLITGLGALFVAPAIVRIESLMPIRGIIMDSGIALLGLPPLKGEGEAMPYDQKHTFQIIYKIIENDASTLSRVNQFAPPLRVVAHWEEKKEQLPISPTKV